MYPFYFLFLFAHILEEKNPISFFLEIFFLREKTNVQAREKYTDMKLIMGTLEELGTFCFS